MLYFPYEHKGLVNNAYCCALLLPISVYCCYCFLCTQFTIFCALVVSVYTYLCVLEFSNTKISLHLLKQHTSESSLNWHGLSWIGGTFESDTGGTFHSDMPGTFQSAADGTFVSATDGTFQSDMSGTFGPMLSLTWRSTDFCRLHIRKKSLKEGLYLPSIRGCSTRTSLTCNGRICIITLMAV